MACLGCVDKVSPRKAAKSGKNPVPATSEDGISDTPTLGCPICGVTFGDTASAEKPEYFCAEGSDEGETSVTSEEKNDSAGIVCCTDGCSKPALDDRLVTLT